MPTTTADVVEKMIRDLEALESRADIDDNCGARRTAYAARWALASLHAQLTETH